MPGGLSDPQVDCGVLQMQGLAFLDMGGGGPDIGQPDTCGGVPGGDVRPGTLW